MEARLCGKEDGIEQEDDMKTLYKELVIVAVGGFSTGFIIGVIACAYAYIETM